MFEIGAGLSELFQHRDDIGAMSAPGPPRLIGRGVMLRHWLALANALCNRDREGTRALLRQIGPHLGNVPTYGYFWVKQDEGFETVRKWAAYQGA